MRPSPLSILVTTLLAGFLHFVLAAQPAYAAAVIHVTTTGSGGADGATWGSATTLQHALQDLAVPGDEIWVATGIYTPGATISHTFSLPVGVAVYGGFAATETLRTQRDWSANRTVLSGDIGGDDVVDASGVVTDTDNIAGDNSDHVVLADGTSTPITGATILDGLTVTAGHAKTWGDDSGAGFFCNGSFGGECSPSLANVIFSGNLAGWDGGAMFNNGSSGGASNPSLANVTFSGNRTGRDGGAMANTGAFGGTSSPSLTDVVFAGNSAGTSGGAMFNDGSSSGASSPDLANVTFAGNRAAWDGGAMFNFGAFGGTSSPNLANVVFTGNSAETSGGAMFNNGFGGASSPSLVNVTFSGNAAGNGGAIGNQGWLGVSSPSLANVILWANSADGDGDQIYSSSANPAITASLIEGGIDGAGVFNDNSNVTDGGGNLDGDPLFVAPISPGDAPTVAGDMRLQFGSPAIDAGANDAVALATDLNGSPRIVDGNGDGVPTVDMGAYEAPAHHTLVIALDGSGSGEVDTNPAGYACAAPCHGIYPAGSVVTLTARAETGSTFTGWEGDAVGDANPLVLTMDGTKTVTATFTQNTYPLVLATVGNGSVEKLPDQAVYPHGAQVTLTATAETGSTFTGWSGDAGGVANPLSLTLDGAKTVTATFTRNTYPLNLSTVGSGSVDIEPDQAVYPHGAQVTLTATAGAGWGFAGWFGDTGGDANPVVLTMNGAMNIIAIFASSEGHNSPPSFSSSPPRTATVGVTYTYGIVATDDDSGDIISVAALTKPPWLALTATGSGSAILHGTPGAGDVDTVNPVVLLAVDQGGAFATQSYTITVFATPPSTGSVSGIVVDPDGLPVQGAQVTLSDEDGTVRAAYRETEFTNGDGTFIFNAVPLGAYSLTVQAQGYQLSGPIAVTVEPGQAVALGPIALQEQASSAQGALYLPAVTAGAAATTVRGARAAERILLPALAR